MERAMLIWRPEDLDRFDSECDRLYYGHEFCQRLIPSSFELAAAVDRAAAAGAAMTLVLPFVTNEGLASGLTIVEQFLEASPRFPEIVVNDWGMAHELKQRGIPAALVLGRLLTKQKRGPRILTMAKKLPASVIEHFKHSNIDVPHYEAFLREELGIVRVELDNTLQGIARVSRLPASLYHPFAYVTTTRQCLTARCEQPGRNPRELVACGRECRLYGFELRHPDMPVPLYIRGNTQFFRNDRLPDDLAALCIDRLVETVGIAVSDR
ncbi:hypothetical protein JW905_01415 [bacterium]|nr:hypothetical protein [candidate division CSSED10-310 bacterium]